MHNEIHPIDRPFKQIDHFDGQFESNKYLF
jgi:hypothetical protein